MTGGAADVRSAHLPVLFTQVMEGLRVRGDGTYLDGTFGRGGHARGVLQALGPGGRLLVMDKDPDAIAVANRYLAPVEPRSYQEVGTAKDEDSGLTVGVRKYGDPDTGLLSVSCELAYGREIGNADALLRIV